MSVHSTISMPSNVTGLINELVVFSVILSNIIVPHFACCYNKGLSGQPLYNHHFFSRCEANFFEWFLLFFYSCKSMLLPGLYIRI